MAEMRLYVWTDVLCDYTCGMIVAIAPDLDVALSIAREESDYVAKEMGGSTPEMIRLGDIDHAPRLWHVCGGG